MERARTRRGAEAVRFSKDIKSVSIPLSYRSERRNLFICRPLSDASALFHIPTEHLIRRSQARQCSRSRNAGLYFWYSDTCGKSGKGIKGGHFFLFYASLYINSHTLLDLLREFFLYLSTKMHFKQVSSFTTFLLVACAAYTPVRAGGIPNDTPKDKIVSCLSPGQSWTPPPYKLSYLAPEKGKAAWSYNGQSYQVEVQNGNRLVLKSSVETKPSAEGGAATRDANHVFQIEWDNGTMTRYWLQVTKDQTYTSQCFKDMPAHRSILRAGIYNDN
jgi:hypothetical protein